MSISNPKHASSPKIIIFDFGNVLFDLDVDRVKSNMEAITGLPFDLYNQEMPDAFRLYETGVLDRHAFVGELQKICGKDITEEEFLNAWNSMLVGMKSDRISLIQAVGERYRIALLSNINEAHKAWIDNYFQHEKMDHFWDLFEHVFLSFELGMRKPDPEIFQHVQNTMNTCPDEMLLIDDGIMHLESAKQCGLQTLYMKPGGNLEQLLKDNNLI
jgi:glucose-1-phosphatase